MKKRLAILLSIALALILSLTSLSVCIGEAAEAADIGLEALFASSWQDYSVRSDDYLMLVLTIHTDLDLASFRRADNGEKLEEKAVASVNRLNIICNNPIFNFS